jgi:hypothetical protein
MSQFVTRYYADSRRKAPQKFSIAWPSGPVTSHGVSRFSASRAGR